MKKPIFIILYLFLIFCFSLLESCKTQSHNYARHFIPFIKDSIATVEYKKSLNNLNDHDFSYHYFTTRGNLITPYRLLPPIVNLPIKKYPLVITLHNSSRIGLDNKSQLEPLARLWLDSNIRQKYQGYVVAPQFATRSTTYSFDTQRGILTSKPEPQLLAIMDLIDSIKKAYNIDEKRVYLVGYSMGASSVIDLLNFRPDQFAAAVAIAGVPQFDHITPLKNIPIWLIHGKNDTENPFSGSELFYKEINQRHRTRFWIFDQRTHDNIISTAILGEDIPKWLFAK